GRCMVLCRVGQEAAGDQCCPRGAKPTILGPCPPATQTTGAADVQSPAPADAGTPDSPSPTPVDTGTPDASTAPAAPSPSASATAGPTAAQWNPGLVNIHFELIDGYRSLFNLAGPYIYHSRVWQDHADNQNFSKDLNPAPA